MIRLAAVLFLLLAVSLWQRPAQASGDFGCETSWQLLQRSPCDNMAILLPGNDTRANLLMLMLDLRGNPVAVPATPASPDPMADWPSFGTLFTPAPAASEGQDDYADGEGSRCRSNDSGAAAFVAQVEAATAVPEAERKILTDARKGWTVDCAQTGTGDPALAGALQPVQSPLGKSFAAYLLGARAFYDGDYDAAKTAFSGLIAADQPWLAETARYMLARVELNRAQVGAFDEYGYPKEGPADAKTLDAAEAGFRDYLGAYPQGVYAASAKGLLRRVYWLGKRTDPLAGSYQEMLSAEPAARGGLSDVDLLDEIDNKLLMAAGFTAPTDPILLAVEDLVKMRGDENGKPVARSEIEGQRAAFASNPALFEYLLALYDFAIDKKPQAVLTAIPAATPQAPPSYLAFSRQALRGMALEATKDSRICDHWLALLDASQQPLQRPAVELALALHDERTGALDKVFAAESKIANVEMRVILLRNIADAALLRRQAQDSAVSKRERSEALFTLLYKELSRGRFADFVKDTALVPGDAATEAAPSDGTEAEPLPDTGLFARADNLGDYDCRPIKETASALAKTPKAPKAQLCLADFIRANGFDGAWLDAQPAADELGGTPSRFEGKPYARLPIYQALIADAKTPAADKAYALYRAVNCYAPAGSNACGGEDVPVAQRKAWFQKLKRDYPKSPWAKKLAYYW